MKMPGDLNALTIHGGWQVAAFLLSAERFTSLVISGCSPIRHTIVDLMDRLIDMTDRLIDSMDTLIDLMERLLWI